ncbi:MAG: SDR family oxidoreductase [Chitinophagaceae bacterium]|nr:SDR family oxidoreductase [Chitinophagaceae bacterium]MCA6468391.1 SDR family oxidoreductase [Chitinophagaceae bacterium]MCA6468889.1 SDR family oxidoreductase [Chitinophagaceae bacterium]MCA6476308.1 SDR family oxidoreductase [Chitinophagaceae bacterium]MCA6511223.1 SDR family oxidoreductase [Chitinophagaceae bacterium]
MATALITGASNGIGLELAKIHAAKGDQLVLVARNKSKLDELKLELEKTYKISVYTIGKDLSAMNAGQEIFDETSKQQIHIDYLINNAGFGDFGMFVETDWNKEAQMIQLNITALTQLTKLYLKEMVNRGSGKIMNVASTAAFQSGPTMAVYYATKAYVLSFSEAIDNEVRDKGVTVTALCPGATESGFQAAAAMEESNLVKGRKLPTSKEVAEYGYESMMKGRTVAIHGFMNYLLANSVRFIPRAMVVKVTRKLQDKSK